MTCSPSDEGEEDLVEEAMKKIMNGSYKDIEDGLRKDLSDLCLKVVEASVPEKAHGIGDGPDGTAMGDGYNYCRSQTLSNCRKILGKE